MDISHGDFATFSDLSRDPRAVAERAASLGRLRGWPAMHKVFPWVRHLSPEEAKEFTIELINALSDTAELDADDAAEEVVAGWRETARIKADPEHYREALLPSDGDFGPVEIAS